MSTRASIRINAKGEKPICLYHHCDGYPDGVGSELKTFVKEYNGCWDPYFVATTIIKGAYHSLDETYELTPCIHGDEEYLYVIDCDEKTITGYELGWDESYEDCIKRNKTVEIP